jgi:hypothetical protein
MDAPADNEEWGSPEGPPSSLPEPSPFGCPEVVDDSQLSTGVNMLEWLTKFKPF